jgi:hypothetical protein
MALRFLLRAGVAPAHAPGLSAADLLHAGAPLDAARGDVSDPDRSIAEKGER